MTLTPAMLTVLREAPDDHWGRSYAHAGTVEALERRGLLETSYRGPYATDLYVKRTAEGNGYLAATGRQTKGETDVADQQK